MYGQYGSALTIAATTVATKTWNASDLPNGGFAAFHFLTTGANNHLGTTTPAVTRIRVKDSNRPLIDVQAAHIRAWQEAETPANQIPVADRLRWTLLASAPRFPGRTGIPFGRKISVEMDVNASSSSGDVKLGYEMLNLPPEYEFSFLGEATGVGANATRKRINLNQPDSLLYGICFPIVGATGITRAEVVVNGRPVLDLDQGLLLESQFAENPGTLTTSFFVRLREFLPMTDGNSYIMLTTGAGSGVSDEISMVTLRKLAA